jgi:hypothetical protein
VPLPENHIAWLIRDSSYSVVATTVGYTSTVISSRNVVVTSRLVLTISSTVTSSVVITQAISSRGTAMVTSSTPTNTPGNGNTLTEVTPAITLTNSIPALQSNSSTFLLSGLSGAAISVIFLLPEVFPLV